jgi:tetratricopeptide (TPR) repeat protein
LQQNYKRTMAKRSRLKHKKQQQSDSPPESNQPQKASQRIPLWQAFVLPVASILIFFLLLEGILALFGLKPVLHTKDPFVGFASNVPLFVPSKELNDGQRMVTAEYKSAYFNQQSFPLVKPSGTYRVFSLGGSTTYGRPYDDITSFSGWLRELLPAADKNKDWEVINAGGISYASYRVVKVMEELLNYQPDLFIIYTGHNEFLEERTYRKQRNIPPLIRSTASLLAHTRTWSAMNSALEFLGISPQNNKQDQNTLAVEVDAILDRSMGPDLYTRDDTLKEDILEHYRISLKRMVALARSVDAKVIFVTPASNLKDISPFKSEHTQNLDSVTIKQAEQMLIQATAAINQEKWNKALDLLDKAVALDPRHAGMLYYQGKVLLALSRYKEAKTALRLARDEDICPLRALTPIRRIVSDVAKESGVGLVDYIDILEKRMQSLEGHTIPGEEFFLDHVHPTIEGHKILAVSIIQTMIEQKLVKPGVDWGENVIEGISAKILERVDQEVQGEALTKLARVLLWAGKKENAARLSRQALDIAAEYPQVVVNAASTLASFYQRQGHLQLALQQLYSALENAPGAVELHMKLGQALVDRPFLQLDEAAASLLLVIRQKPENDVAHQLFGQAMVWRGRTKIAYNSLMEALRLNPNNKKAQEILAQIRPSLGEKPPDPQTYNIKLDAYPSLGPRKLIQLGRDKNGRSIPDGIEVEFHENGRVKRLLDFDQGKPIGPEIVWDKNGRVLSRVVYRQGKAIDLQLVLQQLYSAIEKTPGNIELHLKLGNTLLNPPFLQLDEAAANLLLVIQQKPKNDVANQLFGEAMARRARLRIAYKSLMEALRLNPNNKNAQNTLTQIRPLLEVIPSDSQPHTIKLDVYPSLGPRKLIQQGRDKKGRSIPDGIEVEFHENGRVKRLLDFDRGAPDGLEIAWDMDGRILSRVVYQKPSVHNNPGE